MGVIIFAVLFTLWRSAITKNRQIAVGLFQIAGNLYYVGTTNVTSFLLVGDEGHVLIDGAYPETAITIIESIEKLGFDIQDVKVLLNSHAHADHAGGLAELKEASGAQKCGLVREMLTCLKPAEKEIKASDLYVIFS